ncbi:flagellar hook-length control protein FliK [Pseudovibrio sp. Ad37]|uniref:flagellar hook-length control protein FliK n=1 Tax=Pseudovibrio sp. Ad37 TaxID=989422 RepID=UPI0007AEDB41|nr:flagellar hook-length control protein FliK [Pseudovibrio sp. Ad37]KZL14525.1 Flagellar hook-length control protein FliK [Pseudovibrio sp. Ad37]
MSQSALLSLTGPVQPQTPLGPVVGQGGNALLGESVLGQNADTFSGLLAKASEGDGAAATAVDLFSGALTTGGDLSVLSPNLIKDENGESAVAGLAGELPLPTVSQVPLSGAVPGLGAVATTNDEALLFNGGEEKAKTPFVALPQKVQEVGSQPALAEKAGGAEVDQPVANVQNAAPVVGEGEAISSKTGESAVANLGTLQQTESGGQILPQADDRPITAQAGAAAQEAGVVSAAQESKDNTRNASDLQPGVTSERQDTTVKQGGSSGPQLNALELPASDQVAKVSPELIARSSEVSEQSQNSAASPQVQPANNAVKAEQVANAVDNRIVTSSESGSVGTTANSVSAPVEKTAAPAREADVQSSQPVVGRQVSELATAQDVKSVKAQSEPVQPQSVEVKGAVQSSRGDVLVDAIEGDTDASLEKPVLVRQTDRAGSSFVGNQQRAAQAASVEGDGDIIFPNVTSKPDVPLEKNGQASQVQKAVDVASVQGSEAGVRSAEQVSRNAAVTTAATPLAGKDKTAGGAVQVTASTEAVTEVSDAPEADDLTNALTKPADQAVSADKKNTAPSVSIQVKVPQANEQVASTTAIGWGLAAGPLDGPEAELDWESSEATSSTAAHSDSAFRSMGSLPTSTLRNVANAVWPEIARQASGGVDRFEIRLDPKELGGVDVSLEFSKDGRVRAHLIVERPETLELLQRDQRGLEKALQEAGIESDKSSLQFSLGGRGSQTSDQQENRQANVGQLDRASEGAELPEENYLAQNNLNSAARAGGLDISV